MVELGAQLLVMMESYGEGDNGLVVADVGDGVPRLRETPDVASQRFPSCLMELL